MSNRLLVNPGTPQAWEIPLKPGVTRIGRGPQNDFTIQHQSISTQHCEITVTDTAVVLKDLGSTNGTFVERVPVTETPLYPGQHVQLGSVSMVFEAVGLPALPDAVNLPGDGAQIMVANISPGAPPVPLSSATGGTTRMHRPASSASAPPTPATIPLPPAAPATHRAAGTSFPSVATADLPAEPNLIRGIIGAIVGGALGMFLWYWLIKITGYEIGYIAWGVGGVVGFGARLPSPRGSPTLGLVCGGCALIAILGGQYLALHALVDKEVTKIASRGYREQMQLAQTAVNAKTREEIVQFLASQNEQQPGEITEQDIAAFREKVLTEYQDFVNGKPSQEDYIKQMKTLTKAMIPKTTIFKESFGMMTVLWIFLGVGTAWKIGSGAND